jgi:hypothetical protein
MIYDHFEEIESIGNESSNYDGSFDEGLILLPLPMRRVPKCNRASACDETKLRS